MDNEMVLDGQLRPFVNENTPLIERPLRSISGLASSHSVRPTCIGAHRRTNIRIYVR